MTPKTLTYAGLGLALVAGVLIGRNWPGTTTEGPGSPHAGDREILYWVAPMDSNFRRDEPGKSPMGMDLVPVYADEVDSQPGVVSIDPVLESNLGVRTALAERGTLPRLIDTVGYVQYDEDSMHHVHTRVDGWVQQLAVKASGDPVKENQPLFELYSPTLVNAQQEYLAALRSGNSVLRNASRDRLVALGITASDIERLERDRAASERVRIFSDSEGVVAHLGIREGMFVTPATEVMTVANLDTVWLIAEVFERQSEWVEAGQPAYVELDYLPGRTFAGTVDYVYPELDSRTRTLRARLRFDNAEGLLRPNMFASVQIHGAPVNDVVHVPREAVIRGGGDNRVVVALGDGRFRSQPVRLGLESGNRIAIRSGLSAGARVVTSAQFLIDSESNIDAALSRMGDPEAPR